MSYCQTCNGEKLIATLTMPWSRFVETALPMRIGANSHDISAQDFLKKVRQVPCPNCIAPKIVPIEADKNNIVAIDIQKIEQDTQ